MNDKEFLDLCYDQYKYELEHCEAIYQRAGFVLTAQSVVAGATIYLGTAEAFEKLFTRIDVFFFYAAAALSLLLIVISVTFLFMAVCTRQYQALAPMAKWQNRRKELCGTETSQDSTLQQSQFIQDITERVCEADAQSKTNNEKRMTMFRISLVAVGVSMVLMCIEAVFRFILQVEGIVR